MKISIEVSCPSWMKTAARVLFPVVAIAITGVALAGVPTTFAANDTLKAADLNGNFNALDARLSAVEAKPTRIAVRDVAPFSLPAITFVHVPFLTEKYDDKNEFDLATGIFTPSEAGDYEVCASMSEGGQNGSVGFELDVFVNGLRDVGLTAANSGVMIAGSCFTERLGAGDALDIRMHAASAISVVTDGSWDWMTISKVD